MVMALIRQVRASSKTRVEGHVRWDPSLAQSCKSVFPVFRVRVKGLRIPCRLCDCDCKLISRSSGQALDQYPPLVGSELIESVR